MTGLQEQYKLLQKKMKGKHPKEKAFAMRLFLEELVRFIFVRDRRISAKQYSGNTFEDIAFLYERGVVSRGSRDRMHRMRMLGNRGVHADKPAEKPLTNEACAQAFSYAQQEYRRVCKQYTDKRKSTVRRVLTVLGILAVAALAVCLWRFLPAGL